MKARCIILFSMILLRICSQNGYALIINYDQSKHLEKAQEMTSAPAWKVPFDRDKAIAAYLAFVKEYPKSINVSKVYAVVGIMYLSYHDEKRGIKPDLALAEKYLNAAIEADPEFICQETVYARTNLASMPDDLETRMRKRIEVYKWMKNIPQKWYEDSARREAENHSVLIINADTNTRKELKYKDHPELLNDPKTKQSFDRLLKELNETNHQIVIGTNKSTGINLVNDAAYSKNPELALDEVERELGSEPEIKKLVGELRQKAIAFRLKMKAVACCNKKSVQSNRRPAASTTLKKPTSTAKP